MPHWWRFTQQLEHKTSHFRSILSLSMAGVALHLLPEIIEGPQRLILWFASAAHSIRMLQHCWEWNGMETIWIGLTALRSLSNCSVSFSHLTGSSRGRSMEVNNTDAWQGWANHSMLCFMRHPKLDYVTWGSFADNLWGPLSGYSSQEGIHRLKDSKCFIDAWNKLLMAIVFS